MNTGSWLLGEELQSIVYRIISDSQKQPFEDVFQYRCSQKFHNIHRKICWGLFLIKLQAFRSAIFLKSDSNTSVFLSILQYYHHKHRTHNNFQHLLQNTRCTMVQNWMTIASQTTKEMNPILTLLIMKVKVVTVTMTCTPDHPKHRALNSLHDLAYYK